MRVPNSCNIPNLSFNPVNFTCCHEKNLLAQGQNNTHYTCSRGKYCRLVQFDQSYSLSSCQECYQKAKIQYWLEMGVFFADFLCIPASPRPITMVLASHSMSTFRPIVFLDVKMPGSGSIDRSTEHGGASVAKLKFPQIL